jgi:hypothetical protein
VAATLVFACSSDDSDDGGGSGNGGGGNAGSGNAGSGGGGQTAAVTFTNDIYPILRMRCSGTGSSCHGVDQAPFQPAHGSADVQEAYQATQENGTTGEPVYERILERITSTEPGGNMPPSPICMGGIGNPGCVTQAELDLIEAWIEQGTPL